MHWLHLSLLKPWVSSPSPPPPPTATHYAAQYLFSSLSVFAFVWQYIWCLRTRSSSLSCRELMRSSWMERYVLKYSMFVVVTLREYSHSNMQWHTHGACWAQSGESMQSVYTSNLLWHCKCGWSLYQCKNNMASGVLTGWVKHCVHYNSKWMISRTHEPQVVTAFHRPLPH